MGVLSPWVSLARHCNLVIKSLGNSNFIRDIVVKVIIFIKLIVHGCLISININPDQNLIILSGNGYVICLSLTSCVLLL
ncbi:MAG: hypothetical protein FKGGLIKP_00355 [Sodalis sp. Fse]|nr:MAG: hypothetical protein FKGGLIKP_00355 [Sodalis sp. Fse]